MDKKPYNGEEKVTFLFRNLEVATLNIREKDFKFGERAHMCNFIREDYFLLCDFIKMCENYIYGDLNTEDLYTVTVN